VENLAPFLSDAVESAFSPGAGFVVQWKKNRTPANRAIGVSADADGGGDRGREKRS